MSLEECLKMDFDSNLKDLGSTSKITNLEDNSDILRNNYNNKEESIVWPLMAVVANIPFEHKDDSYLDAGFLNDSAKNLKDEWIKQGYKPVKVYHLWSCLGHSGFAVVEFGKDLDGFENAKMFVKDFEVEEDYYSSGIVGDFLRNNGALKTVSAIEKENEVKNLKLILGLETLLEEMSKRSKEIQSQVSSANSYMSSVMKQIENYNKDLKKLQEKTNKILEHVQMKFQHEDREKEMNEIAMLEQNKAYDRMLKLAYDNKREKENLEKKIEDKEQEINQMKGAMDMMTNENVKAKKKIESIQEDMKEKEKENEELKELNQVLIVKENWSNDKLVDAREDLISGLNEIYDPPPPVHNNCVKRKMEELLDAKSFGITLEDEYDPSLGCYTKELWNQKEYRKATLKEGLNFILK